MSRADSRSITPRSRRRGARGNALAAVVALVAPAAPVALVALTVSLTPQLACAAPSATAVGALSAHVGQRAVRLAFTLRPGHAQRFTDVRVLRRASPERPFQVVSSTASLEFTDRDGLTVVLGGIRGLEIAEGASAGAAGARLVFSVADALAYGDEVCVRVRTEDGRGHTVAAAAALTLRLASAGPAPLDAPPATARTPASAADRARLAACEAAIARAREPRRR